MGFFLFLRPNWNTVSSRKYPLNASRIQESTQSAHSLFVGFKCTHHFLFFFIRIRFTVAQIALSSSHSYNHEKNIYIQKNAKHLQVSLWIRCHWNLTSTFHDLCTTLPFLHPHQSQALPTLCWHRILNLSLPVPLEMTLHLYVCGSLPLWWNLSLKNRGWILLAQHLV